jgi:hypothetical protein
MHGSVGVCGSLRIVRNEQDRAAIPGELDQTLEHLCGIGCVKIAGWFIGKDYVGPVKEGADKSGPLALAGADFGRDMMNAVVQTETRD